MTVISKELQEFIAGKIAWIATADKDGIPNLAPKGTVQVIDDHTLVFADLFSNKTRTAMEQNPNVAVAVIESGKPIGYQFKGKVELLTSGPLYDQVVDGVKKALPAAGAPKYVVKIVVDSIYDLAPGPNAGKKIA